MGIMEKRMETTVVYWGYIGYTRVYIGVIVGLRFPGLEFRVSRV